MKGDREVKDMGESTDAWKGLPWFKSTQESVIRAEKSEMASEENEEINMFQVGSTSLGHLNILYCRTTESSKNLKQKSGMITFEIFKSAQSPL